VRLCTYEVALRVAAAPSSSVECDAARRRVDRKASVSGNRLSVDEEVVGHCGDVWPLDVTADDRRYVNVRSELDSHIIIIVIMFSSICILHINVMYNIY